MVSIDQDDGTTLTNYQTLTSNVEHGPRIAVEEVKLAIKKASASDGKLVIAEEVEKGRVTWKSMKLYFSELGGEHFPSLVSWILGF